MRFLRILLILILVCCIKLTYAHTLPGNNDSSFVLQPHVGIAVSNLSGSGLNSRVGLSTALDLIYTANSLTNLKSGIEYTVMGAKDGYSKLALGYIDVPVIVDCRVYKGLYAGTGGILGINLLDGRTDFLFFSKAHRCNLSIPIDIGYHLGKWTLEIRYMHGITNAYKDFNYKNRCTLITLGYNIPI